MREPLTSWAVVLLPFQNQTVGAAHRQMMPDGRGVIVCSHKLTTCIAVRIWSPSYAGASAVINTTYLDHLSTRRKCTELTKRLYSTSEQHIHAMEAGCTSAGCSCRERRLPGQNPWTAKATTAARWSPQLYCPQAQGGERRPQA